MKFYNALSSLHYTSISCITYRAKQLMEHTFISCQFNKQVFCSLYFIAYEEKENKIKVLHIKEAGPVQFTPLDAEQRQATCKLVNLKNRKPGQELKYVNVSRVCNNIHPNPPKHIQRIQGDGNCLFRALCCAIMGMQTGHKALCQIICDYLCQGTTYMGMDGQDYLANLQMEQDKK